jgi:hypothetical protein
MQQLLTQMPLSMKRFFLLSISKISETNIPQGLREILILVACFLQKLCCKDSKLDFAKEGHP